MGKALDRSKKLSMTPVEDINIPEFITIVTDELVEANRNAEEHLRETKEAPFLDLGSVQLQIAFTAEESKTTQGKLELKPWIASVGGGKSKSAKDAIVHTVTVSLVPATVESLEDKTPAKRYVGFKIRKALAYLILSAGVIVPERIRRYLRIRNM
jgi:hypothetical protein